GFTVAVTLTNGTTEFNTVKQNTQNSLTMNANWATTPSLGNPYAVLSRVGYTPTTLIDLSKTWQINQWTGGGVNATLSNGTTITNTVASNTANTLTLTGAWSTTPAAGNA